VDSCVRGYVPSSGIPLLEKFCLAVERMDIHMMGILLLLTNQAALLAMCSGGFLPCVVCY